MRTYCGHQGVPIIRSTLVASIRRDARSPQSPRVEACGATATTLCVAATAKAGAVEPGVMP